ncbi:MAG TPA: FecR family protein [Burkholderiales bacterium]|nr:FecR family protein [Burkholderiales bacterium]
MNAFRIGLSGLGALLLAAAGNVALAAGAGSVTHLSGTLSVVKPDGSIRILSQKSEVSPGDTLSTEKDSYAQINMTDGSSMTIRPNTRLKIEEYNFVQDKPQEDSSFFRLIRGGLRTVTGLVGKRGNQDAYRIGTSTATIGIRGSSGDTLECSQGCEGVTNNADKLQKGVYHTTYTGSYVLTNASGEQVIGEGQFGFVKDANSAPQILPGDPGLNLKDLPFTLGVGSGPIRGSGGECVVR